ncbi:uncharacterized protein [Dermacentor andersoni]|uniref:uncharacterized protein n=1 Tax=Dermacentor andersoni TaxID=34620 RepID=UPI003B3A84BE
MCDSTDDETFDTSHVMPTVEQMKVEPPATVGRRRRRNCGRRSSAKPRGRARNVTTGAGGKRGGSRQPRAATAATAAASAFVAAAASPQKTAYGVSVKAETAEEVPLEVFTSESESSIDLQAETYVSKIMPDPATIVYAEQRGSGLPSNVQGASCSSHPYGACCEEPPATPPPQRRRGGRAAPRPAPPRRRRRVAIDGDERVVCRPQTGRWSSLLPVGTLARRPSAKLVQLVAQAIHESPQRVLRVTHVYAALQNRYPYFRLLDKKGISSWKSSVRHALFQKWFVKLRPTSVMYESVRPRSFFWGLNYSNRPREWEMPREAPRAFAAPTNGDDHGQQRDDGEASRLFSGLHLAAEPPTKKPTLPSAFRLELERGLFPPPDLPRSPGRERKLPAVRCCEFGPVTSPPQPADELISVDSPSSSPPPRVAPELWKSECARPADGWPVQERAEEQAWQPSVGACDPLPGAWDADVAYCKPASAPPCSSTTATSATATLVEAVVDSFQKPWPSLSGEQFVQLRHEEQRQVMHEPLQEPLQEPQQQQHQQQQQLQMLQAPMQESREHQQQQELQQVLREFLTAPTAQQGGAMQDWLRPVEVVCPNDIFDLRTESQDSLWDSLDHFIGSLAFGGEEPLAPRLAQGSPRHNTHASYPSPTALPTAPPSTPASTPSQSPPAIPGPSPPPQGVLLRKMHQEQAARLAHLLRAVGMALDDPDECFAFVNVPWPVWKVLSGRSIVRRSTPSGGRRERERITAIVMAPPSTLLPTDGDGPPTVDHQAECRASRPPAATGGDEDGRSFPADQADCGDPGSPPA